VKGCELVLAILRESGMRITLDGLGELMEQLKINYKASNKAVLKQVILLTGSMAEACGQPIIKYNKTNLKPLLGFLADKAALMRADVIATANKWSEAIGAEHVINNMCSYLSDGNPELRTESLKWICDNKGAIPKCEHNEMIKPLIMCLTDKSGPIRTMAEEAIVATMSCVGFAAFQDGIRDLKPAVQQTVKPLLDKAKQKAVTSNPESAAAEVADEAPQAAAASKKVVGKPAAAAASSKAPAAASKQPSKPIEEAKASPEKAAGPTRKVVAPKAPVPVPTKVAQPFQEEADELTINPGNKERRALADSKSKWLHDEIKPAHLATAKKSSEEIFGMDVSDMMWSADFKKHLLVIDKMLALIQTQPQELMECVDVIFKWTNVKLNESNNTAFQSSVYDFFEKLFEFLIGKQYLLWEHEADVVIPLFCDKVGNNNAILRQKVKQLIK